LRRELLQLFFGLTDQAVTDFGDALQVALALLRLLFGLQVLKLFFESALLRDLLFFFLPVGLERIRFLANFGELALDELEPLFRVRVVLLLQRLLLDFELRRASLELVDFRR
jgi:hypothetical protein